MLSFANRFQPLLTSFRRSAHITMACLMLMLWANTAQLARAAQSPAEPKLRIEAGMHTAAIRSIDTDAQGRWAVTAGEDKTARVWDVFSGQLLKVLRPPQGPGDEGKLYAVALSPDGAVVAAAGLTTLGSQYGNTVYVFDRSSGHMQRRLPGLPNVIYDLSFSPNGRYLSATLGGTHGIRVWDMQANSEPAVSGGFGASSSAASWSRDGRLVVSSFDGKLRVFRVMERQGKLELELLTEAAAPGGKLPQGVAFHPDGSRIAVGYNGSTQVDVLDAGNLRPALRLDTSGVGEGDWSSVAWSADGSTLIAAGSWQASGRNPVRLWPMAGRGQPIDVPTVSNTVTDLTPLPRGGWLVSGGDPSWGQLTPQGQWQPRGLAPLADLRGSFGNAFMLADGGRQVRFGFEMLGVAAHHFDLTTRRLSAGSMPGGQSPSTTTLDIKDWESTRNPRLNGLPIKLADSETARSLAIAPGAGSFVLGSDWLLRHMRADGTLLWQQTVPGTVWGVNIPNSGPGAGRIVVAAYGDGTIRWHRLSDGQELLAFFPHADRQRWVLWTPSGHYDASPGGEELIGWQIDRRTLGPVLASNIAKGSPAADAQLPNGAELRLIDDKPVLSAKQALETLQAAAKVNQTIRLNWVHQNVSGSAALSPRIDLATKTARFGIGLEQDVQNVEASDFFPASRFRSRFHRPDVIDRVLDTLDQTQALTQADAARGTRETATESVAHVLPPVVEMLSSSELRTASNQVQLRVRGRTTADAPVTGWRVRVNGQLQPDARGLGRQEAAGTANTDERELTVTVPPQNSEIQVFAENRHGASTPAVLQVTWAGAAAAPGFQIKPKLYVLAVGVGAYQDASISRLALPAKDARDFSAALQRQKGKLYREVEVRLLTDAQATSDAVLDGLEWLQKQVTQHDLGVVFLAGHGLNDADGSYLYLPVNANPERLRRTAVPMEEFKRTLRGLAGKALFFFDTCFSGNVLGGRTRSAFNDVTGVVSELASTENGVVVFSSSTGRQLSYEDIAWGNGAFTKALVEGLDGAADFQKNGRITHKMLDLYVSERVKALTKGKQSPVTQAPGGVPDFPVAVK